MAQKIKVQVMLEPETLAKVDDLAEALGTSRAGVCTFCISETIRDDYWLAKHVAAPLRRLMNRWGMSKASEQLLKGEK